ncbi:MAG: succinate dehydrogenase/fumarate reductase cytochrome b subunit [Chloroflexi bacterium]|nr:succinate dehydrogenase/fumarate reductase cytochrome b subunit [Chloroflexota bacterium]
MDGGETDEKGLVMVTLPVQRARRTAFTLPPRVLALLDISLSISGAALSLFMIMHLGLLLTILFGEGTLDELAGFLERYYLLQAGAPFVVLLLIAHVFLAARRTPSSFQRQWTLIQHLGRTRHPDTWTWAFQILSGVALLAIASIHLWVVLTDLPIEADKSGLRIFREYLWLYIPFVVLVESHMTFGVYRLAVKWFGTARGKTHVVLGIWTALLLSLGIAVLISFYRVGSDL